MKKGLFGVITLAAFATCALAAEATVNAGEIHQKISGFGASSAWNSLNATEENLLWDTLSGAGFSLHRLRIDETGLVSSNSNQGQLKIAKDAVKKGVTVWASPWSPVRAWQKKIGTDSKGGDELGFNFDYAEKWAKLLADYARDMVKAGVPLFAISAQNEPDGRNFNHMTADEIVRWVRDYLGPAMEGTGVKIIAPETVNWFSFPSYKTAILADAKASAYIPIIATHEYGGSPKAYPEIAKAGKEFWQTEIYESLNETDMGINSAVNTAVMMHNAIVTAGVNAWHYWWIHGPTGTSLFPNNSSTPAKRLWAMGNYSRFVRPGFYRIGATATPANNVMMTAYKDTLNTRMVVVIINKNTNTVPLDLKIDGVSPIAYTPYVTDNTQNLKAQAEVSVEGKSKISYTIPAKCVVSLVFKMKEPNQEPFEDKPVSLPGRLEFENYDIGGSGISFSDSDSENKGGAYRNDAVDIDKISDNNYVVSYTNAGEWLEYTVDFSETAKFNWKANVSMGGDAAAFHMNIDGEDITDEITIEGTGSWDTYKQIVGTTTKEIKKGTHILKVSIDKPYANLDWIEFVNGPIDESTKLNSFKTITGANSYKVYDAQGVYMGAITHHSQLQKFPQGLYIVKAFRDSKLLSTQKWAQMAK